MVTSNQSPPSGFGARDLLQAVRNGPPRCLTCNSDVLSARQSKEEVDTRYCDKCRSFQKIYRGPPRRPLCDSCFNRVFTHRGRENQCAAFLYQTSDGTWHDRYGEPNRATFREGGMYKDVTPIKPVSIRRAVYSCETYEYSELKRDEVRLQDPLKFFDRTRFFDADRLLK